MLIYEKLRASAEKRLNQAQAIREQAIEADRILTDEEREQIADLDTAANQFEADAVSAEQAQSALAGYSGSRNQGRPPVSRVSNPRERWADDPARGFASPQEFFLSILSVRKTGKVSEQLRSLEADVDGAGYMLPKRFAAGSDEHGIYTNPHGGFLVPEARSADLLEVVWEGDPTATMTRRIPMGVPKLSIPARVDNDHSTSVSGGFVVYRASETQAVTASRAAFKLIELNAHKLMGVTYATSELINYSPMSIEAIINAGFSTQFASRIVDEKLRGTGVGQYLGILNSPARIEVAAEDEQDADTINYNNVVKMLARGWGQNLVWMINHSCLPQLATLRDAGGNLIWQPDARVGFGGVLMGRPVLVMEECSAIGDVGDIILADWGEYLEGTLRPIEGASSIHVRFLEDETAFRFTMSNAGAPWWSSALTPKYGPTRSPIVTLAAR